ncbi:MAG: tetratricopeptide repeat protein [Nitrososphaerota archaeon]
MDIDPKNSHILRNKASAFEQLGDFKAAEDCYKQAHISGGQ